MQPGLSVCGACHLPHFCSLNMNSPSPPPALAPTVLLLVYMRLTLLSLWHEWSPPVSALCGLAYSRSTVSMSHPR